jgi:mevalonate pyrophosphate decarboxylase
MTKILQGDETNLPATSSASVECSDVTTIARLSLHVKENHLAYLVGVLVAHQMGLLDKFFEYGVGVCA